MALGRRPEIQAPGEQLLPAEDRRRTAGGEAEDDGHAIGQGRTT